jgi:hypothetical protein
MTWSMQKIVLGFCIDTGGWIPDVDSPNEFKPYRHTDLLNAADELVARGYLAGGRHGAYEVTASGRAAWRWGQVD